MFVGTVKAGVERRDLLSACVTTVWKELIVTTGGGIKDMAGKVIGHIITVDVVQVMVGCEVVVGHNKVYWDLVVVTWGHH